MPSSLPRSALIAPAGIVVCLCFRPSIRREQCSIARGDIYDGRRGNAIHQLGHEQRPRQKVIGEMVIGTMLVATGVCV